MVHFYAGEPDKGGHVFSGPGGDYELIEGYGQILDMVPSDDNPSNDTFVMVFDHSYTYLVEGSPNPEGKYIAARYKLSSDRLLIRWSEVKDTKEEAQNSLPDPFSGTIICDGSPTFCYDHEPF